MAKPKESTDLHFLMDGGAVDSILYALSFKTTTQNKFFNFS